MIKKSTQNYFNYSQEGRKIASRGVKNPSPYGTNIDYIVFSEKTTDDEKKLARLGRKFMNNINRNSREYAEKDIMDIIARAVQGTLGVIIAEACLKAGMNSITRKSCVQNGLREISDNPKAISTEKAFAKFGLKSGYENTAMKYIKNPPSSPLPHVLSK